MENFLIVKLSAIGDVIHALPVAAAIKETYPKAHLTWVVEPPAYDLVAANPCVDEIIVFEKKKFRSFRYLLKNIYPFRRRLKEGRYDVSLDLQGLFKSAAIVKLAGAGERLGTADMREGSNLVSRPVHGAHQNGHIVERYLDVARAAGCRVDKVTFPLRITAQHRERVSRVMTHAGANMENPYAVLAVGANWPNKRWGGENLAALVDWLYEREIIPVLTGSGVLDESIAAQVTKEALIPPVNLVGRTSLMELAALIERAEFAVGGDTGALHLTAALGRPAVMLMGPTDANRNGPYGQSQNALEASWPCRGCWKRACPEERDCLADISLERVTLTIERILEQPTGEVSL